MRMRSFVRHAPAGTAQVQTTLVVGRGDGGRANRVPAGGKTVALHHELCQATDVIKTRHHGAKSDCGIVRRASHPHKSYQVGNPLRFRSSSTNKASDELASYGMLIRQM